MNMEPFSFSSQSLLSAVLLEYTSPSKGGVEETWRDYFMLFCFCLFLCFVFFGKMREQEEVEMGSEKFSSV